MSAAVHLEEEHEEEGGMERWLLTYADMITLLLALFIVLFAMSTIDIKKYEAFKTGVAQAFAPRMTPIKGGTGLLSQNSLTARPSLSPPLPSPPANPLTALEQRIQAALAQAGLSQDAVISLDARGLVVRMLTDKVFFATYSAALGSVGQKVVDTVGGVVATVPNAVEVEGYTDNQPIIGDGPYRTNWDLSAARAMMVVDRLAQADRIDTSRLSGTGYGDTKPIQPNDTPAHQAANRRVDVVILSSNKTTENP
ncbi:MAG TPA: flagellar motor protein MotB [Acidimicrobiales bacterium]|nr:flagellar motor protein MotB [Acidimicrobiales bacterium]